MSKKLSQLVNTTLTTEITGIAINSKKVKKGDLFVCIKTRDFDRHDFIEEAIKNGAAALIVNQDNDYSIPAVLVANPTIELTTITQKFYDNPQNDLIIIGITGTDGKTSVATIIQSLLGKDICGVIGTNGLIYKDKSEYNGNTTPDPTLLYAYIREMVDNGIKYLAMEASSEAFLFNRLCNLKFDASIFTNLSQDHLNNHKTMENYLSCKLKLFKQTKAQGPCVINSDEQYAAAFSKAAAGKVVSYGQNPNSTLSFEILKCTINSTNFNIKYHNITGNITSPLTCDFNVYNLSAALLVLLELNFKLKNLIDKIPNIIIEGRMHCFKYHNKTIMIDFAHTPNAINNIFNFVKNNFDQQIVSVTGAAGDRDSSTRFEKGQTILNNSSYTIFTSDDPRFEDPSKIALEMAGDFNNNKYEILVDRETAIKQAIKMADENALILILGKGSERKISIKDKNIPYCDIDVVERFIKNN